MKRVLVIESDLELSKQITQYLAREGYECAVAVNGFDGYKMALESSWRLIFLERDLVGMNGIDLLRKIRKVSSVLIFMISKSCDEVDRILALELGADDILSQPFDFRELAARFKSLIRRTVTPNISTDPQLQCAAGDVRVLPKAHCAYKGNQLLNLSNMEYRLLEYLVLRAGTPVSREELMNNVMFREYDELDRGVDLHISSLRKKLGPYEDGSSRIRTIRCKGYLYALPADVQDEASVLCYER